MTRRLSPSEESFTSEFSHPSYSTTFPIIIRKFVLVSAVRVKTSYTRTADMGLSSAERLPVELFCSLRIWNDAWERRKVVHYGMCKRMASTRPNVKAKPKN